MNILTVTHFYESHRGGIELVAGRLQRELSALGAEAHWAAASSDAPPGDGAIMPVPLATLDPLERLTGLPMPLPRPGAMARLWRAVKAADAVIIHDALYATSIIAMLAAKWHKRPTLLIQHIGDIPFGSRIMRGALALANRLVARPMLRGADQLIFISDTVRRHFGDLGRRVPPLLMFNGVDHTRFFLPDAAQRRAAQSRWGIATDRPNFLFVGRFVEKKGLSILHAVARGLPDMQFHIVGQGPIDPAAWGLPNITVHGPQAPDAVASLMQACHGFILPSVGEGYPLVIQEAMACGLTIFCGEESARADPAATPFLAGVAIDLAQPAESAAAMIAAIREARIGLNAPAAAFARARYDWAANARSLLALLGEASRPPA